LESSEFSLEIGAGRRTLFGQMRNEAINVTYDIQWETSLDRIGEARLHSV
jgi:hypothetical protein